MPILDQCLHQFVWPRRATDGRYYQVCSVCEAEFEYDWESMQRLQGGDMSRDSASRDGERRDGASRTAPAPEMAAFRERAHHPIPSCPKLLLKQEPAHLIFLQNLTDLVLSRTPSPIATTSAPAPFWNDVFVSCGLPWWWFLESLLGHMIVVTALLILFQKWPAEPIQKPSVFHRSYITYYKPPKSFSALGSHGSRVRPQPNRQSVPAHPPTIRVKPERIPKPGHKEAMLRPPDIMPGGAAKLRITAPALPAPLMPLSATGRSRLNVPAGPTWVVAPPPDSSLATARRSGTLQPSAVAPAPEVGGVSSPRAIAATSPHASIIAPPPSVAGPMSRVGGINIGESTVVRPAPQFPRSEQRAVSALGKGMLGNPGSAVVPPPPSVQSSGTLAGGRPSLLTGTSLQIVPPVPSVQEASQLTRGGGGKALSAAGSQVIPPAPSVPGAGNAAGSGRANSLSTALEVPPPAPSVPGAAHGGLIGRTGSLSSGLGPVPPAPSLGDGNGGGRGRLNSLSTGAGLQAMPPAASAPGADAGAGHAGEGEGTSGETNHGEASATDDPHEPATVEIPLRLIGPVLALPGSSYFSNYEVFIAERKLGKGQAQLIKLVYVSLPYQRRLSEYGPNNWTVPKLRVTRDQTCDESLLQMTWPDTDPRPDSQHAADSPALSAKERNAMLPCYRTTADDYLRALSRSH